MTKAQIIDKYIQRIMVDYPEADKINIDLVQFAEELRQCDVSGSVADAVGRNCPFCGEPCVECSHKATDR